MAEQIVAQITRDNYHFRSERIPKGSFVSVSEAQFKAMTRDTPATAKRSSAKEAKDAGATIIDLVKADAPEASAAQPTTAEAGAAAKK